MTATGYTGGDPRKVDVAGDTMTGDLVLPADPDQNLEAATKQYVDTVAGGGVPSGTVVTETSFGQASTAGVATTFSRGDHTHGTPAAPTAASVGAAPDTRTITAGTGLSGGGDLTADRTLAVAFGTTAGTVAAGDDPRFASGVLIADSGNITSGNVSVGSAAFVQLAPDLTITAAAGDVLEVAISALCDAASGELQFEAATRVSGADTNWWSSGGAASLWPAGIAAWYVSGGRFTGPRQAARYTVQAGDVAAGQVTVRLYCRSDSTSRSVFAAVYPLRWGVTNLRSGT